MRAENDQKASAVTFDSDMGSRNPSTFGRGQCDRCSEVSMSCSITDGDAARLPTREVLSDDAEPVIIDNVIVSLLQS